MAAGATARRAAAGHPGLYTVGHSVSFLLHCDRPSPPAAPASLPAGTGSPPSMKEHDGRRQGEDGSKARSALRIQARSRATSAGNGATGNAGAPHTGQPDGTRDSQCLHARTGIGILLRLRRNGAISPGTLCTPRHAAASSQRKGLLRRASTGSPHRFTPLSSGGGEAQQQGQATRALVVATSSVACRSRDAWLRENGFSLPFPQMGEKERSVQSSSRGEVLPLMDSLLRLSADK